MGGLGCTQCTHDQNYKIVSHDKACKYGLINMKFYTMARIKPKLGLTMFEKVEPFFFVSDLSDGILNIVLI